MDWIDLCGLETWATYQCILIGKHIAAMAILKSNRNRYRNQSTVYLIYRLLQKSLPTEHLLLKFVSLYYAGYRVMYPYG